MKFTWRNLTVIIIILIALLLAVTSVWNDSPIVDEIPHIGAGYSYIAKGDHRLNPEHPPLAKDLAGISLKMARIKDQAAKDQAAFESKFWREDINGQWEFGRKLLFNSNNDAVRLVRFAKMPQLIFFLLSAILIFVWTRKLYGYSAALIALFLFSFSPTVLAHSRFVTTDMPALFGVLIATYFFIRYLERPTKKNLWLAGLIFGIAQLTKFSVFLLVPFFLGLALIHALLNSPKSKMSSTLYALRSTLFIFIIGYLFIVWPVYYFHTWNYPSELQQFHTKDILTSFGKRWLADTVIYLADKPVIRGMAEYGLGLLMVVQRSAGGNTTYFMGEVANRAWPQYFPTVYFLKEPLAFWLLLALISLYLGVKMKFSIFNFFRSVFANQGFLIAKQSGQFSKIKEWFSRIIDWAKNYFTEMTMLLWIALYWYTSIRSNLNIGVRHLMPVYGFTFILLSGQLVGIANRIMNQESRIKNKKFILNSYFIILASLFGWYLYENLAVYPYYLTYFNQVALLRPSWVSAEQAGYIPGGHWYVVDSNLDWGQDLKRLADWVKRNNIQKVYLDYFGWADQNYYLKERAVWMRAGQFNSVREFLLENPEGGYMAISASFYMGSREKPETSYAWLDNYKPVLVIGNSIFVWYIQPFQLF